MCPDDDKKVRHPRVLADVPEDRRRIMAAVRHQNTGPELQVRSLLHRLGYRFTVNGKWNRTLPGRPDVVLPKWKTAIFVHGCFWHGHEGCKKNVVTKTRTEYWLSKIARNVARDAECLRKLELLGWNTLVIWECELRGREKTAIIEERLRSSLKPPPSGGGKIGTEMGPSTTNTEYRRKGRPTS